jgi:hypothetical protein
MTQPNQPASSGVLYPNLYAWLVIASSLDVLLTSVILHIGGGEANPVAARIIRHFDIPGMTIYKFLIVSFFILICETVGRLSPRAGKRLAIASIVITCVPVMVALVLISGFNPLEPPEPGATPQ